MKKKIVILSLFMFIYIIPFIILLKPINLNDYEIYEVNVKVIEIKKNEINLRFNHHFNYDVRALYDDNEYVLNNIPNASYQEGMNYKMYYYDNTIYRDINSVKSMILSNNIKDYKFIILICYIINTVAIIIYVRNSRREKLFRITKNMKIKEIRGSRWYCRVIFNNGKELRCDGELGYNGFDLYTKSLKLSEKDKKRFIELFNEYIEEFEESIVNLV